MSEEQRQLPDDGSPPGHLEKMLGRKAESDEQEGQGSGETVVIGSRPENVPEQFWNEEKGEIDTDALLKSQADGQAEINRLRQGGDEETGEGEGEGEAAPDQANVVEAASAEFAEKGELSEDTFKSLEAVGLSRDMVNSYIEGQNAIVSSLQEAAYGPFEGKDGYNEAANWAAENLTDDEIKALDVQLTSNNPAIVAQGAKSLAKMYADNADIEPSALRGDLPSGPAGSVYRSRAEMIRDMRSTKYRTDAGFRQEVQEKLRRSNLPRA